MWRWKNSKLRVGERGDEGRKWVVEGWRKAIDAEEKKRWKSSYQNEMFIVQGIYVVIYEWVEGGWCIFVTCAIYYYKYIL